MIQKPYDMAAIGSGQACAWLRFGNGSMTDQEPGPAAHARRRRAALAGLVFILLLVLGGLYLAHELRGVSQLQDCVMSGRSNCAPIDSTGSGD